MTGALHTQSVVRVRAPLAADRYGNRVRDWAAAVRATLAAVNMQPAGSPPAGTEDVEDRQTTVAGWSLYSDRGTDLDLEATDRIEYAGLVLEVDGEVARWPAPGGGLHHVEARLKAIT